jgi:hypothetical protein
VSKVGSRFSCPILFNNDLARVLATPRCTSAMISVPIIFLIADSFSIAM